MGAGAKVIRVALAGVLTVFATTAAAAAPAGGHAVGGGLTPSAAAALVRQHGYSPVDTTGYDPGRALSVIIGMLATSADGHPQQAFLFHEGHYVRVDTPEPSATVTWVWSTDAQAHSRTPGTVALQYQLYRPDDPMCCPTGGAATVRFQWLGGRVVAADPLPSAAWEARLGRR
jgi:hypothetical protein